ncbi:MAG: hypothetical protein UW09_C0003G0041 [candidate division TM6 bacterium GW2011_GWF2_43_87]|nr:MAG: hypothetical protein UW09_C0003G0041 [candidate division TM6 bacterium GW2011_GWF2_43_87]
MKKTIYSLALITLAIACPHIGNAMDNNNPPNLNPLKRLFSEVSPDQTSSSTSQNEQNRNKFRRIQNRPTETTNTPNLSQQQTPFAPQPQQNPAPTTLVQPQIIQNIAQQSQQNNTSRLISLLLAFLSNPQTNNTTNFSIFQAPITLQQINPQSFFEPQRFLTPQNTLNWLFLQTSPEKFPASHPLNPDKSQTKFAT